MRATQFYLKAQKIYDSVIGIGKTLVNKLEKAEREEAASSLSLLRELIIGPKRKRQEKGS